MTNQWNRHMDTLPLYYEAHHPHKPGVFRVTPDLKDHVESAMGYKAKAGDLFICSYPKCGTTWLQNIVWHVTHGGRPLNKSLKEHIASLEFVGSEGVASTTDGGRYHIIKTHFPYNWVPKHSQSKYIFIAREPKDACVSLYYHIKGFPEYAWENGSFDDLAKSFLNGKLDSSDYFDTLNGWYAVKDEPSVLFLLYENLLTATEKTIMEIAEFLGREYVDELSANNHELLKSIVRATSLDKMKKEDTKWYSSKRTATPFIRKGAIGDWKNHMSNAQAAAFDEKLREASGGNGSEKLWIKWQ